MRACGVSARHLNAPPVIRANRVICGPIVRTGSDGPLITQITLIVDVRNLRMVWACGVAARYLNAPPVICVNPRNLRTYCKSRYNGPLIPGRDLTDRRTSQTRVLHDMRACGVAAKVVRYESVRSVRSVAVCIPHDQLRGHTRKSAGYAKRAARNLP
jgi:hypothetical protein